MSIRLRDGRITPKIGACAMLIGPAVHGEPGLAFKLLMGAMFTGPWGASMWMSYYKTLYPTRKPEDFPAYTAALKANLSQPGRMAALRRLIFAPKIASEERMDKVSVPSLVIMGSLDRDFPKPREEAEFVAGKLNARLQMVEGAGHYPHAEMPEVTIPMVLSFLQPLPEEASTQPQEAAIAS